MRLQELTKCPSVTLSIFTKGGITQLFSLYSLLNPDKQCSCMFWILLHGKEWARLWIILIFSFILNVSSTIPRITVFIPRRKIRGINFVMIDLKRSHFRRSHTQHHYHICEILHSGAP